MATAAEALAGIKIYDQDYSPALGHRRWRLVDRLGEQGVRDLLTDRRSGIRLSELAERYGISLSSVKRTIKRRGRTPRHKLAAQYGSASVARADLA